MSNLDMFNEITAKVFAECYENFPVTIDCNQDDYVTTVDTGPNEIFYETMLWLKEYDYITFWEHEMGARTFYHVQLTEKGLSALNMVPDSLKEKVTMGSKIASAVKSGAKDIMSECIRQAVKYSIS